MEEKKNNNIGLIIFLILIILGLAGYICYDKFIANNETKCLINNNGQVPNKAQKDEPVFTYDIISGIFEYKVDYKPEGTDDLFSYFANLYLLEDGTIRFNQGDQAANGYVGNYIIDNDELKITEWFGTGSDASLGITKTIKTFTYKIKDKNTIIADNCYYNSKDNQRELKTVNASSSGFIFDFKDINSFLSDKDHELIWCN